MGAYRSKPSTEKVSEAGEFKIGNRRVLYGATAMQGWRISMEVTIVFSYNNCFICFMCLYRILIVLFLILIKAHPFLVYLMDMVVSIVALTAK